MEHKSILAIIRDGESGTVEFKRTFDREAIETLAAFANSQGGSLLVGVSDSGGILGVDIGKETVQNWINQVKVATANTLVPDAEAAVLEGKTVVLMSVPEYPIKPVACRGRYFKRANNANHQMTISEVVNEHLKSINTSWDCTIDDGHSEADISLEKVQAFIERINRTRDSVVIEDPLTVLRKFELLRDGRITRAAFLLFSATETGLTTIEMGRFQTPTLIKDGARLKSDLFSEVEGVMAFLKKHMNKAYIITGEPQREERWEYPLEALREVVINAVVHRDYTSTSDSIVKVFEDRIEIFNPGRLPNGLTVEKLLAGDYVSIIRNRKIADMFKEAGLIEKYGTGIRRILQGVAEYGLPSPHFEEIAGGFRVTVYCREPEAGIRVDTPQVTPQLTPQITPQVRRLLAACPIPKSLGELQQELGLSDRKHFQKAYLNPSLASGLIERTSPDKPRSRFQRYRLTAMGKRVLEESAKQIM